jgi:UDP-N-acetylmuramate--alanine ligase
MEGVRSEMILEKMTIPNKKVLSKDEVKDWIKKSKPKVLVMAGAGDIDVLIQEVKVILESQ